MKIRKSLSERLIQRFFYKYYSRNLLYELQLRARSEAADYVQSNMAEAMIFGTHREIVRFAGQTAPPDGLFLEFGVATGNTLGELSSVLPAGAKIYGFDSFAGLPGDWSGPDAAASTSSRRSDISRWSAAVVPPSVAWLAVGV